MPQPLVAKYHVPDVIWESIAITEAEDRVIQTATFSRLKGIKQMGVAAIKFAGAQHTRFEHCIGVMHCAYNLLGMVREYESGEYLSKILHDKYGENGMQAFRIAALLHDLVPTWIIQRKNA